MRYRKYVAAFLVLSVASAALVVSSYRRTREEAIEQLYIQERILAQQAATSIEEYFAYYARSLAFLGAERDVVASSAEGRRMMKDFYLAQSQDLASVSRVDERGKLVYTYPHESHIGTSVADQSHVKAFLAGQRPLLSRVFRSVQGFDAVALYLPVFEAGAFRGGLAILVPFARISRRYLERVSVGGSGYAILLDKDGTELYSPVEGRKGRSIYENAKDSPELLSMAEELGRGASGRFRVRMKMEGEAGAKAVVAHAYASQAVIEGSAWSVIVLTPEADALVFIDELKNRWIWLGLVLLAIYGIWGFFLARAFGALKREEEALRQSARLEKEVEERTRELHGANASLSASNASLSEALSDLKTAQARLVDSERMAAIGRLSAGIAHEINTPLGAIESSGRNILCGIAEFSGGIGELIRDLDAVEAKFFSRMADRALAADGLVDGRTDARCLDALARIPPGLGTDARMAALDALQELGFPELCAEDLRAIAAEGGVDALARDARLAAVVRSACVVETAARRAAAVVRALLSYSGEGSGQMRLFRVDESIEAALELLGMKNKKGIEVVRAYEEAPSAWGDPAMLERAWIGLVENATFAMDGRGRLAISVRRSGESLVVSFEDNGRKIPEEQKPRIFDPLFATDRTREGPSLGLDVCKRIVESSGGSISFESRLDSTVFTVLLRRSPEAII